MCSALDTDAIHETTDGWRLMLHPDLDPGRLLPTLTALPDPALVDSGAQLLQKGRNTVWRWTLKLDVEDSIPSVLKVFGRQNFVINRLDTRGCGKALRAFRAARFLETHGVGTPKALAAGEQWRHGRLLRSWLLTREVVGATSFKATLIRHYRHDPDCGRLMNLLENVARAMRRLHDCGVWHRDLGNQNIMLLPEADRKPHVLFLDLNRARWGTPLSLHQRAFDLSRIHLPSDMRRVFHEMYWGNTPPPKELLRAERRARKRYALHAATRPLRHPIREHRNRRAETGENDYPDERNIWIWDERSVQAIAAWSSHSRHRHYPLTRVPRIVTALAKHAPGTWRAWRTIKPQAFKQPLMPTDGIAVALAAKPDTLHNEIENVHALGVRRVLLRFYHHESEENRRFALTAFDTLKDAGFQVAGALVQDRRALLDSRAWEAFCANILEHVADRADWMEFGHAVNRVKWGLWGFEDFARLTAPLPTLRRAFPSTPLVGPAVIDFEFEFALAALDAMPRDARFDALSLHLYVDRRGAPENRQGPFSALDKFALARAIAQHHPRCTDRVIVSEFNWPLAGTGAWSPVGSPYESPGPRSNDPSVSETDYARYMVRYLLLALCSGYVDVCVLWRLAAHGFGLIDDRPRNGWRPRPAFYALRHLLTELNGARLIDALTPCRAPGAHVLHFLSPNGKPIIVAWAHPEPVEFSCPFTPQSVTDHLGTSLPRDERMVLDGNPRYIVGAL